MLNEAKIYQILQGLGGIPQMYWAGQEGNYNVMAMELLGPSLEDLLTACNRKLSLPTVVALADQLVYFVNFSLDLSC